MIPLVVAAAWSSACREEPKATGPEKVEAPPLVVRIEVRDGTPRAAHPVPALSQSHLVSAVRGALARHGTFEVPPAAVPLDRTSDRRSYRVVVETRLTRMRSGLTASGPEVASVAMRMEVERVAGGPGLLARAAEATVDRPLQVAEGSSPEAFWLVVVSDAAEKAFRSVVVQLRARERSVGDLLFDLKDGDVAVRAAGVRELGERRERKALRALVKMLDDRHQDVVLPTVGALGNLRDERAVHPLVDSTRGRSVEYVRTVIMALRTIGGVEAEAFLDTIATGHGDAQLRATAREALQHLRARGHVSYR